MSPLKQLCAYWSSTGSSPSPSGGTVAGGMPFDAEEGAELEREAPPEDCELRAEVDGGLLLGVSLTVALAVSVESLLPSSRRYNATPIAATTTTPATMSAIRVFLLPVGG